MEHPLGEKAVQHWLGIAQPLSGILRVGPAIAFIAESKGKKYRVAALVASQQRPEVLADAVEVFGFMREDGTTVFVPEILRIMVFAAVRASWAGERRKDGTDQIFY